MCVQWTLLQQTCTFGPSITRLAVANQNRGTNTYAQLACCSSTLFAAYHVQVKRLILFADSEDSVDDNVSQLIS